jgi:hypothetical protein
MNIVPLRPVRLVLDKWFALFESKQSMAAASEELAMVVLFA